MTTTRRQDRLDQLEREVAELKRLIRARLDPELKTAAPSQPFGIKRAAALVQKSPATIRKWCRSAPWAYRVGGTWEIDRRRFVEAMAGGFEGADRDEAV